MSHSAIDPYFKYDLFNFKNEAINNLNLSEEIGTLEHYERIIVDFQNDNFTHSLDKHKASNEIFNYLDRESFLYEYYSNYPNDKLGEGEFEYIISCINGFLYSYQELTNSVVDYLKKIIASSKTFEEYKINPKHKNKKILPKKSEMTEDKIKDLIFNNIKFLIDVKSQAMENIEFERLQKDIYTMVDLQTLPSGIQPYKHKKGGIKREQILAAFFTIQKEIYNTSSRDKNFIHFFMFFFPNVAKDSSYDQIYRKFSTSYETPFLG